MPTLPDLFETLGAHGEHAGADVVMERALARAGTGPTPVRLTPTDSRGSRRTRNYARALVAATLTIALIAVPVALSRSGRDGGPSREPSGAAYPPPASATAAQLATLRWSRIAEAPIALMPTNQVVAWAGDELVVFGQDTHDSHGAGAAYTPATNRWRKLPRAPLSGSWFFRSSWTWTGRELIVFPDTGPDRRALQGEAYSPRTNSWRVLAPAPLCTVPQPGVTWTGHTVVVAGGYNLSGSQCSDARAAASASYDPRTNRWTKGPALPVRAGDRLVTTTLVWAGARVIAVVGSQRKFALPSISSPQAEGAPITKTDPIVRGFAWAPGDQAWSQLDDVTGGLSGETPQDRWTPYAAGSRVAFPPSLRFCGEGEVFVCSLGGVHDGSVYNVITGRHVALPAPSFARYDPDTTAFTGGALIAMLRGSTEGGLFAWDLATGRRTELADPPADLTASAWTGTELISIAFGKAGGPAIAYRLG